MQTFSFGLSPNAVAPNSLLPVPGSLYVGCVGTDRGTSSCWLGPGGVTREERSPGLTYLSPQMR